MVPKIQDIHQCVVLYWCNKTMKFLVGLLVDMHEMIVNVHVFTCTLVFLYLEH